METPFDQIFFGIMALNIGVVLCLILINLVKGTKDSSAKINAKKTLWLLKEFQSYKDDPETQGTNGKKRNKNLKKTGKKPSTVTI